MPYTKRLLIDHERTRWGHCVYIMKMNTTPSGMLLSQKTLTVTIDDMDPQDLRDSAQKLIEIADSMTT